MFQCKKCKSNKIKTRTNTSFGKSFATAVICKDCGSTNIEKLSTNDNRSKRRRR